MQKFNNNVNWNVKETFFNSYINDMAALDRIKWFCLIKLTLHYANVYLVQAPYCSSIITILHYYSSLFFKIDVLKYFPNFTGKHQCWSLFLIKLQDWGRLQHRCFPVNTFLRKPFFRNTAGGCFSTNPGDTCGSLCGEGVFWSFSTSLPWLSNIMLKLLSKSSFDISLLFKLNYAVCE